MDAENLPDYDDDPQEIQRRLSQTTLRAMDVLSRTDPGMKEMLDKARVYYALKGSPSIADLVREEEKQRHLALHRLGKAMGIDSYK